MAEPTIGDRIRALRKPAYTQDDLAAAAQISVDVIRKLEQGRRRTASIGTLQRIARALDVDIAALLSSSRPVSGTGEDQPRVEAIRVALTSVDDLLGELDGVDAPDLAELSRAVTYAWGARWAGRYGLLVAMVPRLLAEAAAATHDATAPEAGRAVDLAAQIHQITAEMLLGLDASDLGYVAAREALRLAALVSDPLRAAAARQGRAGATTELLAEATAVAQRTEVDRTDYEVVFGPGCVVMQAVDCAVVTENYVAAAEVARRMPTDSALPLISRSRHLLDVAHAQLRLGHDRVAESTLLVMERATPQWATHQRLPRVLIGELLARGRPSPRLRELAHRLNATRALQPS